MKNKRDFVLGLVATGVLSATIIMAILKGDWLVIFICCIGLIGSIGTALLSK